MPVSLVLILLISSRLIRRKKYKKWLFSGALLLLIFFSNGFLANEAMLLWELEPKPINSIENKYSAGIVLTGMTKMDKSPHDRVYFNKGADRVVHALQLYKSGLIEKIIISGGSGSLFDAKFKESDNLRLFLILAGVPDKDIWVENESRNTYENAHFTNALIHQKGLEGKFLLITSAFHMRRSALCFKKTNVNFEEFSTDFYSHDRNWHFDTLLFPSLSAIKVWEILIREWIGITVYKIMGYA